MSDSAYESRFEITRTLAASPEVAFEYLDDPHRLSSHMGKSSWMMMGSKMDLSLDAGKGKKVGSEIILKGKMMGLELFVREKVTERAVSQLKAWETYGPQKMIVIDQYRMGFSLEAAGENTRVSVFIEYNLPKSFWGRVLGQALGDFYARWCTKKMVTDAMRYFSKPETMKACCH